MRHISLLLIPGLIGATIGIPVAARACPQDAASQQSSSQDSSVADAARRNRDKKKNPPNAAKSTKVLTDDTFERKNFPSGQEGAEAAGSAGPASGSSGTNPVAPDAGENAAQQAKDAGELDAKIARLKVEISEAENGLDFARRQLALDQDSYFSQTDYARDTAGKAKLDGEKQGISDREQKIEGLKSRLATLEAKSRANNNGSQAEKPAQTESQPSAPPQI